MSEKLKYVSQEYQERLDKLSSMLVTPERFGRPAVKQLVLFESEMGNTTADPTLFDDTIEFDPIED